MNLSRFKDTAGLCGALTALFLIGGLLWFFTGPARDRALLEAVNQVLSAIEEPLRLDGVPDREPVTRIPLGKWYTISGSEDRMLVFPLISGGSAIPCGAVVNPEGTVGRVIPLGTHGEQLFRDLPRNVLRVYIHRIEEEKQ
jgi:hypothetical protein